MNRPMELEIKHIAEYLPSLEEYAEQEEKYLKQNGYDTIGNARKIWQDAANWALNYVAKKAIEKTTLK